jgi:hypothetical protein
LSSRQVASHAVATPGRVRVEVDNAASSKRKDTMPDFHHFRLIHQNKPGQTLRTRDFTFEMDSQPLKGVQKIELSVDSVTLMPVLKLTLRPGALEIDLPRTIVEPQLATLDHH